MISARAFSVFALLVLGGASNPALASPQLREAGEEQLCGNGADGRPRILIGRFSLFGDFEASVRRSIEPAFTGSLLAGLLALQTVSNNVFAWGWDASETRRYGEIAPLLDEAFLSGTSQDDRGRRQRADLARTLRAHNCDYLFAGRIAKDGNLISVTPYLFNAANDGKVEQPFTPAVLESQSIFKAPERFSADLMAFLQKKHGSALRPVPIEVGCLHAVVPEKMRRDVEALAGALRRRLHQDLSGRSRFSVPPLGDSPALCSRLSSEGAAESSATISAELHVKEDRLELRPVVKFFYKDERQQLHVLAVFLPAISRPADAAIGLLSDYGPPVRSFLTVVMKGRAFPDLTRAVLPESSEALVRLWNSEWRDGEIEHGALAAYRELSRNPDSSAAYYVLGSVFHRKGEKELAREHLLRAIAGQGSLPVDARADLNEAIGLVYAQLRNHEDALKYFAAARASYESLQNEPSVRRVGRHVALAHFMLGREQDGFAELKAQGNLDSDSDSLLLLGRLAALTERYDEAEEWLGKVRRLQPDGPAVKRLLAEIHAARGQKELVADNLVAARKHFREAVENQPDVRVRYLSGLAAYSLQAYADAIDDFEKVVAEKTSLRWAEGAWLTLLECYLLTSNYPAVEHGSRGAIDAIGGLIDSRLVIDYLRFIAAVLVDPSVSAQELETQPSFVAVKNAPAAASAKKLRWGDSEINEFLAKQTHLDEGKKALLERARQRVHKRVDQDQVLQ